MNSDDDSHIVRAHTHNFLQQYDRNTLCREEKCYDLNFQQDRLNQLGASVMVLNIIGTGCSQEGLLKVKRCLFFFFQNSK